MTLLSLPPELIGRIFQHAGLLDIVRSQQTCCLLRDVLTSDVEVQYGIELLANGKMDCRRLSDGPISLALDTIRRRESRWKVMACSSRGFLPPPNELGVLAQLSFGILLVWCPGIHTSNRIMWKRLCSDNYDWVWNNPIWHEHRVDFQAESCSSTLDASQDLLVVVERLHPLGFDLHLRTLSDETHHPDAEIPVIRVYPSTEKRDYGPADSAHVVVRVISDHVIALYTVAHAAVEAYPSTWTETISALVVYNWKTGVRIGTMIATESLWVAVLIISHDMFLLPNVRSCALDAFGFSNTSGSLRHIASFELPGVRSSISLGRAQECGDSSWPDPQLCGEKHIYCTNPLDSIIALRLSYLRQGFMLADCVYVLVVHRSTLLSFVSLEPDCSSKLQRFSWDDWGLHGARFMARFEYLGCPCANGSRLAMLASKGVIQLHDYSKYRKRPVFAKSAGYAVLMDNPVHEISVSTVIEAGDIFQKDVVSSLPYQLIEILPLPCQLVEMGGLRVWPMSTQLMMDDERIITWTNQTSSSAGFHVVNVSG